MGLGFCMSSRFPGDADMAGPHATLSVARPQDKG